ncbi:hypothetical protein [Kribbella speibonae]|uniref:Ig-like domain-containing protein n=1 Tax=Kribbella speibonae TaxID=1572660 RepID=A0ABY1ZW44_9ACTN|nr:hypothetical protein [Kribbella speibonae]TCC18824.1 hypothetical protein E0H58_33725 [Kribbella speibonae]
MRRVLAALLAAPLMAMPLVAQAAPDPELHIESVTLNKTSVAVSGLNTAPIMVTVKGKYDADENTPVNVILERTGGSGQLSQMLSTNLVRNEAAGTWSGPLNVPSTANGTFKVIGLVTGPFFPPSPPIYDVTPYAGPSIAVTGTHQPRITAVVTPKVVPFNQLYSIKWAVSDAQTGKPYGTRLRVFLGTNSSCVEYFGPRSTNLTDTNGVVTKAYPGVSMAPITCLLLPGTPDAIGWLSFVPARPGIVSAAPAKSSAPVGTVVPVNGSVQGAPYSCPVHLQRLYGATQWRTVSSATVRQSGRFTVNAQPAYQGTIPYRASFPKCRNWQAGVSKAFSIRGT